MGAFTKGDIVLFPFPYTSLKNRKIRPCLVLSEEMRDDVLLCQITSTKISKDNYSIELKKDQTEEGSLMINSYIRANMLFTAHKQQINKKICKLKKEKYSEVVQTIHKIIAKNP